MHSEDTDYLYFVADKDGHNHFSKTYEEHLAEVHKIYGNDTATSSNTEAAVQAGPNYDVAVATTEPNYNYSSEEAVEADSQYVNVEPTYKYTPTTVPAAEFQHQHQLHKHQLNLAPATQSSSSNSYVPTTTPAPESMQNVVPSTQQVPHIEVEAS